MREVELNPTLILGSRHVLAGGRRAEPAEHTRSDPITFDCPSVKCIKEKHDKITMTVSEITKDP